MTDITFRELGRVAWGPTMKLAYARSTASSLVITLLMTLFAGMPLALAPVYFFALALTFPLGGPMYYFMFKALGTIFGPMTLGVATLVFNILLYMVALIAAAGDPIVYYLNRRYPELLDVSDLKPFNFKITMFVLREEETAHV